MLSGTRLLRANRTAVIVGLAMACVGAGGVLGAAAGPFLLRRFGYSMKVTLVLSEPFAA